MPKKKPSGAEASVPVKKGRTRDPMQGQTPTAGKRESKSKKGGGSGLSKVRAQCTAHKRNGDRCSNPPVRGSGVCRMHGGAAPQVRAKANQRLIEMILPALSQLRKIIDAPGTSDTDRIKAIQAVLNRTGYNERHTINVGLREETPFDRLTAEAFSIQRGEAAVLGDETPAMTEEQRRALGPCDDELDAYALDTRRNATRAELDRETYLSGLDDADVVVGRVVEQRPNLDPFNQEAKDRARSNRPSEHDRDPQGTARRYAGSRRYEAEED